ncbi:MAG: hypothetical protein GX415_01150 [Chloroflexi bacterium]|nr:hypothetical protein [Anaerolineaceae bacterium]NLI44017.1 hypothetical protein [Chloroflexota bacterium]HOE34261.1 hypothetical protein [Anaerolineaceae bacterium]HOT25899.1 hypothetical protein [Anaerolineaceae bacterium]HQH58048.1 hypothetical protein [Anaerolineaceae bacterium]
MSSAPEPAEELPAQPDSLPGSKRQEKSLRVCGPSSSLSLRYGLPCPFCLIGRVDYDSQLNLVCANCGKTQTGTFT